MTPRDFMATHDSFQSDSRRRSSRSTSSKSPSPVISRRSPSPRVAFTATTIRTDAKGLKNITRKVVYRRLEDLGHPAELLPMDGDLLEEAEEQLEVESVLKGAKAAGTLKPHRNRNHKSLHNRANGRVVEVEPSVNGGSAKPKPAPEKKVDWEIPRKLLHSSIGVGTLYLYLSEGNAKAVTFVLWMALCIIIPADILRLNYPPFERTYERVLGILMRESEKKTVNGVVWYILGVNFVLSFYPRDVATVSILILSWADTAASTIGRLFGSRTPRLPACVPFFRIPFAPRKSLAGFLAASITGACIAIGFWGWIAPLCPGNEQGGLTWSWDNGVRAITSLDWIRSHLDTEGLGSMLTRIPTGGWSGLMALGVVSGLVSGVAEALDVGSVDDNLTLPIISGGCILAFFKFLGLFASS